MRISVFAIAMMLAVPALAQVDLNERVLNVRYGEHGAQYTPIAVKYGGDVPDQAVTVKQLATGKEFPATVRAGELVFVPEGGLPGREHEYMVHVHNTTAQPMVRVEPVEGKKALEVYIDDVHFTTYHFSEEYKKSFLWPVYSDGVEVTRGWPMGEKELTTDHPHQKSLWVAYGDLNGVDLWAEGANSGVQVNRNVDYASGGAYGWIVANNVWQDKDGGPVVDESREMRFYAASPRARMVDITVTFTATYGDVVFGDTKEGGIVSVRMRDAMIERLGGTITLSDGRTTDTWGKPSPWCDYSGPLEDGAVHGVAIFDHPDNLRHPTRWHVRDYGLMGANCFGLSYFTEHDDERLNGDFLLEKGQSLTFTYRVYIHTGDAAQAQVATRYANYATPPRAEWTDAP